MSGFVVNSGSLVQCAFGTNPSPVMGTPGCCFVLTPAVAQKDTQPFINLVPFGMCSSLANPSVAAATSAAFGVLTPQSCIPAPTGGWIPDPSSPETVSQSTMCMCSYGGLISVVAAAQPFLQIL